MIETNINLESEDVALPVASSNFESRRVERIDDNTLRILPTTLARAFSLLFVVLGLVIFGLFLASKFTSFDGPGSIPLLVIGLLFFATGIGAYYDSNEQLVVNRNAGVMVIKSWSPSASVDATSFAKHVHPQDITAIQTISRVVKRRSNRSAKRSSYTEYQVNLRTLNGERHNLFITLKPNKADDLGNELAKLFDVPLNDSV